MKFHARVRQPMTLSPVLIFFCVAHSPNAFLSLYCFRHRRHNSISFSGIFFVRRLRTFSAIYTFLSMVLLSSTFISRSAYVFASYSFLLLLFFVFLLSFIWVRYISPLCWDLLRICSPTVFSLLFSGKQTKTKQKNIIYLIVFRAVRTRHTDKAFGRTNIRCKCWASRNGFTVLLWECARVA